VGALAAGTYRRFTHDGVPEIEADFRTHRISPVLSDKRRERRKVCKSILTASRRPCGCSETGRRATRCSRMRRCTSRTLPSGCLRRAGLDGLECLPRGDGRLTRRAKPKSIRSAVVVRFRNAMNGRGLLLEPQDCRGARLAGRVTKRVVLTAERSGSLRAFRPLRARSRYEPAGDSARLRDGQAGWPIVAGSVVSEPRPHRPRSPCGRRQPFCLPRLLVFRAAWQ